MLSTSSLSNKILKQILSRGVDERIHFNEEGLVKYGISLTNTNLINRGSCTCNPITEDNLQLINTILTQKKTKQDWIDLQVKQANALKAYINLKEEDIFDVFFAPSGTDLSYYPIIISKLTYPEKPILNLITCAEELGSGTLLASKGKYHFEYNQFGEAIKKGSNIYDKDTIQTLFFHARYKEGGIYKPEEEIIKQVEKHPNHSIIINLVLGSKSGIEDNLEMIDKIKAKNIIWNVDLCQFRHDRKVINRLLSKNVMVMITGSKFYQSPPFCGATLLPKSLTDSLTPLSNWEETSVFGGIFSRYDFPLRFRAFTNLPDKINIPNILRWQCALEEIKKFNAVPLQLRQDKIKAWNKFIIQQLDKHDEFELMPDQQLTNKTIVSFRVKHNGIFLDHEATQQLYFSIVKEDYSAEYPFKNILIGQPVSYGNKSFLRLAIGSKSILEFIQHKESSFVTDSQVIQILLSKLNAFGENNKKSS